jgi:hypothetical protein
MTTTVSKADLELAAKLLDNTAQNGAKVGLAPQATEALARVATFLRSGTNAGFAVDLSAVRDARKEIEALRAVLAEMREWMAAKGIEAPSIVLALKPPAS